MRHRERRTPRAWHGLLGQENILRGGLHGPGVGEHPLHFFDPHENPKSHRDKIPPVLGKNFLYRD